MKKNSPIENRRFGRLLVIKRVENDPKYNTQVFQCLCDCGNIKNVRRNKLMCGRTNSCGCLKKEVSREKIRKIHKLYGITEHGHNKTERLYRIYRGITRRTRDLKDKDYGGRGIKCLWKNVVDFYADMEKSYFEHVAKHGEKNTSIDRIDNDGHYCKENCRWATALEQSRNRRIPKIMIELRGEIKTLEDWAKEMKVSYSSLYHRVK
jgi:hypothetical protein